MCEFLIGGLFLLQVQCQQIEIKPITKVEITQSKEGADLVFAQELVKDVFGPGQWDSFFDLINKESGWKVGVMNRAGSGACGLGQALPCSKMGDAYGSFEGELTWAINYVKGRYQTPENALYFWQYEAPKINGHNWY